MPPLSEEMSKKLHDDLKPLFDKFDDDGSGAIDVAEMTSMIESLGLVVPPEKIKKMVDEADDDKSGQIEFGEFFDVVKKESEEPSGGIFASIIRRLQNTGPQVGWNTEK
jgi:Ca2+-binding EF-hand superfamily protein